MLRLPPLRIYDRNRDCCDFGIAWQSGALTTRLDLIQKKIAYLLLHLPPLRIYCVGGCWDRTKDSCDFGIGSQAL
jgi:hypothetical protein